MFSFKINLLLINKFYEIFFEHVCQQILVTNVKKNLKYSIFDKKMDI